MGEDGIERPRDVGQIERVDEQLRVQDFAAAAATHEPVKLRRHAAALLRGLLLERTERSKLALVVDDLLHRVNPERSDQLVLEVRVAHVEPERLHVLAREAGRDAGAFKAAPEVALLTDIAQSRQNKVHTVWSEPFQEA